MQENTEPPFLHSVLFLDVFGLLRAGVGVACLETGEQGLMGLNNREKGETRLGGSTRVLM